MKETAIRLARAAGALLLSYAGTAAPIRTKGDQSNIVTDADLASEKLIVDGIREEHPGDSIVAEEMGYDFRSSDLTWIVDPLDGTSNFAAGVPWFGVLIAVLRQRSPVVGVLYLPVLDDLYVAERGAGTVRNGRRVSVSTERELGNVLWAYGMDVQSDPARANREVAFLASLLGRVRNIRATNSLLDAALTADGRFGGMVNFSTKVWDIAAPSLIVQEAGGAYTDLRGEPLAFGQSSDDYGESYAVVGGAPALHRQVVGLIAQSGLLDC